MKNKRQVAKMLMKKYACTAKQAKIVAWFFAAVERAVDEGHTPQELDKQGILILRNQAAEEGSELTPSEMQEFVDLINMAMDKEINKRAI